jgi:hypothetical protein
MSLVFGRSGSATPPRDGGGGGASSSSLETAIRRLEAVADRLEGVAGAGPGAGRANAAPGVSAATAPAPPPSAGNALADWDARVAPAVAALVDAAAGMDKEVRWREAGSGK